MLFCRLSDLYLKEVFVIDLAKMWGQSSHVGHDHLSQELAQWLQASTALAEFQAPISSGLAPVPGGPYSYVVFCLFLFLR